MSSNEKVAPIDVDGMSDEELDSFIEESTGVDMNESTDVVDDDTEVVPVDSFEEEEEIPLTEETTTEDVNEEEEEETTSSLEEEEEETPSEEEEVEQIDTVFDMSKYGNDELAEMSEVYEDLFKNGIKAAGVDRTVRDPEHLKTLVRIGLGANENNRKIKPYLKQLRSLEQAGVSLEDDNLNFLVDVMNGDKDAIKELVKNRVGLDEDTVQSWYDDEGYGLGYTPKNHVIPEQVFKITENIESIRNSPVYTKTVDFLDNLDDDGRVILNEYPELVQLINKDMESGVYQKAMDEVYYRDDRGFLPKQSMLQSYIDVMKDPEFYNRLPGAIPEVTNESDQRNKKEEVVKRKKRASSVGTSNVSTKGSSNNNAKPKDVIKMSDEEFDTFYDSLGIDD